MNNFVNQAKPVIILLLVCAALIASVVWLMNGGVTETVENKTESTENIPAPLPANELEAYNVDIKNRMNPIAEINTNKGTIEIELFEDVMPITAGNFAKLAESGFYDGVKFHRVIDGFMIQGEIQ